MLLGRRRQELAVAAVNALASMEGPEATDLLEWAAKRGGVVGKLSGGHLTRRREKGRS
jgi:hypothetical protein